MFLDDEPPKISQDLMDRARKLVAESPASAAILTQVKEIAKQRTDAVALLLRVRTASSAAEFQALQADIDAFLAELYRSIVR